jgi:hypothetical protein
VVHDYSLYGYGKALILEKCAPKTNFAMFRKLLIHSLRNVGSTFMIHSLPPYPPPFPGRTLIRARSLSSSKAEAYITRRV